MLFSLVISLHGFDLHLEKNAILMMLSIFPSMASSAILVDPRCITNIGLSLNFGAILRNSYQESTIYEL